jgi:NAD(P)H-hydrate repair Nnr-like enzyme with NAD(P)H-hydrate epimerase domain
MVDDAFVDAMVGTGREREKRGAVAVAARVSNATHPELDPH